MNARAGKRRLSQPTRILAALAVGLALGIIIARSGAAWTEASIGIAEPIGGVWLNALQMTVVPLVVSLLITGVAAGAEAARANKLAARALMLFVGLLWLSSALAMLLVPGLLALWPMPGEAAAALRTALGDVGEVGEVRGFAEFIRSFVPSNPIGAAAESQFLPLIFFTLLFGFALTQLPPEPRQRLTGFFRAVADVMLVMIGWVLWLAPIGIFALAYAVGARAGAAAFGALLHYVVILSAVGAIVTLLAYPVALFGARLPLGRFARAVAPAQAVAVSTQSSLASLPAMLRSAERLDVPVAASGIILPLAVAVFRITGPAMNLAVVLYVAHWFGMELGAAQIAAGVAVAAVTTMGSAGVPGQVSFISSIAPIAVAMGVPIAPLALLLAVETVPDIFRTLGNVTMDVAATTTVARRSGYDSEDADTREDRLLGDEPV